MQGYPKNWKYISAYIRFIRDSGQCQHPHCSYKITDSKDLHCCHINHKKDDCRPSNLITLCKWHHPAYDTSQRIAQTQINFSLIAEAKGQMRLW